MLLCLDLCGSVTSKNDEGIAEELYAKEYPAGGEPASWLFVVRSWRAPDTRLAWPDSSAMLESRKGEAVETFARGAFPRVPRVDQHH